MNVGIDARKYFDFGIGTYIRNLAVVFDRQAEDQFTYIATPQDAGTISAVHRGKTIVNRSAKYSVAELFSVSRQANRAGLNLFHAPHYTLPVGLTMRSIVTVHDVIHLRFPEYFSTLQRSYARIMIGHACRASESVIVDSAFAADELTRFVRCPAEKIRVIPLGVSSAFAPAEDELRAAAFKRRYNLAGRILLYVGSLKPHKNFSAVLRSLSDLSALKDLQVVCVGEKLEENAPLKSLCTDLGLNERVRSLGWLPDGELIEAYQAATALLMPSFYEGFGFPVLEAMACGIPVVASNAASIPEVAGDAAILFNPSAGGELTDAVRSVLEDSSLRSSLREKGLRRARQFTWERCADATLKLYRAIS